MSPNPKHLLVACWFVIVTIVPVLAGGQLKISVNPSFSYAPAVFRVRMSVPPDEANRYLELVADGDQFYRSSEIELEGMRSPVMFYFELKDIPEGDYRVSGTVKDRTGRERSTVYQEVKVIGLGN